MAGHFVLNNISHHDLQLIFFKLGQTLGPLQHVQNSPNGNGGMFPGWTAVSRQTLTNGLQGNYIGNRAGLPPHKYVTMPTPNEAGQNYIRVADWVNDLVRPNHASFGTTALNHAAQEQWRNGNKLNSLLAQLQNGAVSIEVYHIDRHEMT